MAKRAREAAVREKRERKQAKKAEAAAAKRDGVETPPGEETPETPADEPVSA